MINLLAGESFTDLLVEYWYVAASAVLLLVLLIVALTIIAVRVTRQIRENSNVTKARRADKERSEQLMKKRELKKQADEPAPADTDAGAGGENPDASEETSPDGYEFDTEVGNVNPVTKREEEIGIILREPARDAAKDVSEVPVEIYNITEEDQDMAAETVKNTDKAESEKVEKAEKTEKVVKAVYRVSYDKETKEWLIKKDGAQRVIRRCRTKAEALELANQFAENQDLSISVQKKDGKFQKKTIYTKMIPQDKGDKQD